MYSLKYKFLSSSNFLSLPPLKTLLLLSSSSLLLSPPLLAGRLGGRREWKERGWRREVEAKKFYNFLCEKKKKKTLMPNSRKSLKLPCQLYIISEPQRSEPVYIPVICLYLFMFMFLSLCPAKKRDREHNETIITSI